MRIRKHYFVSGRVQGVGFRYRAYSTAQSLGLPGHACNPPHGRVEVEVQGDEMSVRAFLDKVGEGTFISIDGVESYNMELKSESGFDMR